MFLIAFFPFRTTISDNKSKAQIGSTRMILWLSIFQKTFEAYLEDKL